MHETKPLGGKYFTPTFNVCLIIIVIAAIFAGKRYIHGLGAVTNMNDGYPWGIWIAYDDSVERLVDVLDSNTIFSSPSAITFVFETREN